MVLAAVVRVTTDHRIYKEPSSLEDALGFCDDLLGQPHCQVVEPGERHWEIFRRLSLETDTRGTPRDRYLVCRAGDRMGLRVDHI